MARSELVDLDVYVHHRTAKAVLIDHNDSNTEKLWLPLSRIEIDDIDAGEAKMTLPRRYAEEKGLC
jgi:hypothetical protein